MGQRDLLRGKVPHKFETEEWLRRSIWCSLDPIWHGIWHLHQNVSWNVGLVELCLETSISSPTSGHSCQRDPFRTQTTATGKRRKHILMNGFNLHMWRDFLRTFSTDKEKAINGSLSRATFNKYSILIMEFPLEVEMGDDRRPIFWRWTGPPMFKPMAWATASWNAALGLSR